MSHRTAMGHRSDDTLKHILANTDRWSDDELEAAKQELNWRTNDYKRSMKYKIERGKELERMVTSSFLFV